MKNTIHFILQGKGGVGKSTIAALLSQYLQSKNKEICCIDTDPVNTSFFKFKGIDVEFIKITNDNNIVESNKFDYLIEKILSADCDFIIDCGSSTFLPIITYIEQNEILELLHENNKDVVFNIVFGSGASANDSLISFSAIIESIKENNVKLILWKNEFLDLVEITNQSGNKIDLEDTTIFKKAKHNIIGIITLDKYDALFGETIKLMLEKRFTFDEFLKSKDETFMNKHRIKILQRNIYNNISAIDLILGK